jgi:hypothetical protein
MRNDGTVSREDIWTAKAESRRQRAADSFDSKLVSLVRMQMMNYEVAGAAGRAARKPWHFDDRAMMDKISQSRRQR